MRAVVKRQLDAGSMLAEPEQEDTIKQLGNIDAFDLVTSTGSHLNIDKQKDILQKFVSDMQSLGLTINEIKVYLCLAVHGGLTGSELSRKTGIQRTESYTYLSQLMTKGLVHASFDRPTTYYATSIEVGVKNLSKAIETMINSINSRLPTYLTTISQLVTKMKEVEGPKTSTYGIGGFRVEREIYQHLAGTKFIISKMHSMLQAAKKEVEIVLTPRMLSCLWYQDMDFLESLTKLKVPVKVIASANKELKNEILETTDKIRFANLPPTNSYVVIDSHEVLAILESENMVGLWTTNKAMIDIVIAANRTITPSKEIIVSGE